MDWNIQYYLDRSEQLYIIFNNLTFLEFLLPVMIEEECSAYLKLTIPFI